jgi:putative PIN family toxin of toxin-antitoxin system
VRIVLETNVLVSAVFFGGVPGRILEAWRDGTVRVVLSAEILDEYRRVGHILASDFPGVDIDPFLSLLAVEAEVVEAPPLSAPVSSDPDDDKFLACAIAGGVDVVVSGDRDLLVHDGWRGLRILRPRRFADERLTSGS